MNERIKPISHVVTKALADEGFARRLKADPAAVLRAEGVAVPAGLEVRVVEDTDALVHLVLPPRSALSEEALRTVTGGNVEGPIRLPRPGRDDWDRPVPGIWDPGP